MSDGRKICGTLEWVVDNGCLFCHEHQYSGLDDDNKSLRVGATPHWSGPM